MKEAANAHYADRYHELIGLLTNAPKDATPQEIFATMQAAAESAHQDLTPELAKRIKVPRLVKPESPANKKVVEEQQRRILELEEQIARIKKESEAAKQRVVANFRQRLEAVSEIPEHLRDDKITGELAAEPDPGEAGSRLTAYLASVINRVLLPHMALHLVNASVRYAGRDRRIMVGDFLQKDDKGTKVKTLAKCTAIADYEQRRRVREWVDGKWGKERVVFSNDESVYTVITEAAARLLAPGAF